MTSRPGEEDCAAHLVPRCFSSWLNDCEVERGYAGGGPRILWLGAGTALC
jgi:hypothetical protein